MIRPPRPALLAPLLVATLAGCSPKLDNPTTVKDLRLLAIRAEPPEVLIDFQQPPAALPTFTLEALVVQPNAAGRAVTYQAQACGNDPEHRPEGQQGRAQQPASEGDTVDAVPCPAGSVPIASGTALVDPDGTAAIAVSFTPTLAFIQAAISADPASVTLGLPIKVSFTLNDGEVVAFKRVLLSPRLSAEQLPNRNPQIGSLLYRSSPASPPQPFAAGDPPVVPIRAGLLVRVDRAQADAQAESYQAQEISRADGRIVLRTIPQETLRFSFFATAGSFSPATASTQPALVLSNPNPNLESVYRAPSVLAAGESPDVHLYVVVRDERGGSSWLRARLTLR